MALGDGYVTTVELKSYAGDSESTDDAKYDDARLAASRAIDHHCGRQFNLASSATARIFYPDSRVRTRVDDFASTSGLVIKTDDGNDGTYETTWASTDYQLEPLNNVVDGEVGWPFYWIRAVGSHRFPCVHSTDTAPLQVTAAWGWTAVPGPVKQACLMLSLENLKLAREAPFGVAGYGGTGFVVRVKDNPRAMALLSPYVLTPVLVA